MSPSPADAMQADLTQRRGDVENTQREEKICVDPPHLHNPRSIKAADAWPVETDIYILPDGRVVVADLPAELAGALARLGIVEPCEIADHDRTDSAA
ncbi:MAG: hypothetical protein BroJett021_26790 [Chloroflexota bacterium]|nr:hypothetical protein [Caldilinea sp.]GIK73691.1 MAG: hypothetical protein BroJett021_26790 [Chloroflexota bacterium]